MRLWGVLLMLLATATWAQDTTPHCAEQSSDMNNWHDCGDPHQTHDQPQCTLFHPCHDSDPGPAPAPAPPKPYHDDPRTWQPQYQESYIYDTLHDGNKFGSPLPWELNEFGFPYVQAQGLLDRMAEDNATLDMELYRDWLEHLEEEHGLDVYYTWEDPASMKKAIEEINDRALKIVEQVLRDQIARLQPFSWDSPQLKAEKFRVAKKRIAVLDAMRDDTQMFKMDGSYLDTPRLIEQFFAANGPHKGQSFRANETLKELIEISKTGAWESVKCSEDFQVICGR